MTSEWLMKASVVYSDFKKEVAEERSGRPRRGKIGEAVGGTTCQIT
jgi:hypothetical protein